MVVGGETTVASIRAPTHFSLKRLRLYRHMLCSSSSYEGLLWLYKHVLLKAVLDTREGGEVFTFL